MIHALAIIALVACGEPTASLDPDAGFDIVEVDPVTARILLKKPPDGLTAIWGQSNAVGQGDITEVDASYKQAFFPVTLDDYLLLPGVYTASGPLAPRPVNHFGIEQTLGRALPARGIVRYAEGSTSLATDWAPGSSLRTGAYAQAHTVEARVRANVTAIVWMQGEQDSAAGHSADSLAYGANLQQLITEALAEFPHAKFYYYRIPIVGTFSANVRAGQTACQSSNAIMLDVDDLPIVGFHFTSAGILTLGTRFAAAISP